MHSLKKALLILATVILSFAQFAAAASHDHQAEEHAHQDKQQGRQAVELSPELRALLNQEMVLIQQGMMNLIPALSAGEWDKAASIGKKIKESFILKQTLTKAQKEELHRVLPEQFIEMDRDFHKSAGMLAHAAEMKNADVVNFYFYKMNAACVSCHGKFAAKRFPGLIQDAAEAHHH